MFVSNPRKVSLTLFCSLALVLALATVAQADSLNQPVARDHVAINRMMKKRMPQLPDVLDNLPGTNGAAANPPNLDGDGNNGSSTSTTPSSTSSSLSSIASSASDTDSSSSTASSSAPSSSASSTSASASSVDTSSSSASSISSSAPASQSSGSSTSSTASSPSSTLTPEQQQQQQSQQQDAPAPTASGKAKDSSSSSGDKSPNATVTGFVFASASASPGSDVAPTSAMSVPKTAITVIGVIAACVAAVVIGWTIIRKWKFKPSSSFEDRMAPIDWQPSTAEDRDPVNLHRTASAASHGSFHSSSAHGEDAFARGGAYGASSLQPIPDHDFTAGPTTLAPVGGYADLARGPSPGPQMAQLNRGPSTRSQYESYGVPLHHQGAYDYNGGAPRY